METIEANLTKLMKNPTENSKAIRMLAKFRYDIDGEKIQYPNEAGELILFEPSKAELKFYEEKTKTKSILAHQGESLKFEYYFWAFFLVTCNILGLITPFKKKKISISYK